MYVMSDSIPSSVVGITLDDGHAKEMAEAVSYLNQNATGKSHLDMILERLRNQRGHTEINVE